MSKLKSYFMLGGAIVGSILGSGYSAAYLGNTKELDYSWAQKQFDGNFNIYDMSKNSYKMTAEKLNGIAGENSVEGVFAGGEVIEHIFKTVSIEEEKGDYRIKSFWINNKTSKDTKTTAEEVSAFLDDNILDVPYLVKKIRSQNQRGYYKYIDENYPEFEPYLKEGRYTEITPEIEKLGNDLRYYKGTYTDNPINDYVSNVANWISFNIRVPETEQENYKTLYKLLPAEEVLDRKYGYCDERAVLLKALLIHKGIPAEIRIIEGYEGVLIEPSIYDKNGDFKEDESQDEKTKYTSHTLHSYVSAFLKWEGEYQWVAVDSGLDIGTKMNLFLEKDVTKEFERNDPYRGNTSKW